MGQTGSSLIILYGILGCAAGVMICYAIARLAGFVDLSEPPPMQKEQEEYLREVRMRTLKQVAQEARAARMGVGTGGYGPERGMGSGSGMGM
jgi:hypothetical protein